jgi:hypothetical protein
VKVDINGLVKMNDEIQAKLKVENTVLRPGQTLHLLNCKDDRRKMNTHLLVIIFKVYDVLVYTVLLEMDLANSHFTQSL